MRSALPADRPRPPSSRSVDAVTAFLLDESTIVLFGASDRPLPASGVVEFTGGDTGRFHALSWQRATGAGVLRALVLVRFSDIAQVRATDLALVPEDGGERIRMPRLPRLELDPGSLFARLRTEAAECAPSVLEFLRTGLDQGGGAGPVGRAARFVFAFLHALSQPDGFVEIFGRLDEGNLLLQGWSFHLPAGERHVIVETTGCTFHDSLIGTFARGDLSPSAHGVLLMLRQSATLEPAAVRRVYFQGDTGFFYLDIFENRTILGPSEAAPHLRSMLPRLDSGPAVERQLKRACNARYQGHETISALAIPVRAALDIAVAARGVGVFLSGWVLDPAHHVQAVTLRSATGKAVRLDTLWHRTARADVTRGYACDPLFAGYLRASHDLHGYIAFAPWPGELDGGEALYLELALAGDDFAFMPVVPASASPATVHQVLSSVNLNDARANIMIEDHVGPAVAGLLSTLPSQTRTVEATRFGRPRMRPQITAVLPVLEPDIGLDLNLGMFAADSDFRRTELVIVATGAATERLGPALRRYSEFYDIPVRLLVAAGAIDHYDALEIGAEAAVTELLLFISRHVLPSHGRWLSKLTDRLATHEGAALISPTLLYEDHSVRYAGTDRVSAAGGRPLAAGYAGYGRNWLEGQAPRPVRACTMECCLLSRAAFQRVGGFAKDYVHPDLKGLDLSLKLGAAGIVSLWAPDIELFAIDETQAQPEYWAEIGRLVDRWSFTRRWIEPAASPQPVQ